MGMSPRLLRPILSGDPDALRYIAAVQAADQQSLELPVRKAITDFIVGCKADGIWSAIKASCILAGARTLSGALVPLVGTAPTNNGPFVTGDYNRKTGLIGNGSSKYLDSNRNTNTDPQDSFHHAVYCAVAGTNQGAYIGAGGGGTGATQISVGSISGTLYLGYRNRNATVDQPANNSGSEFLQSNAGSRLIGSSRAASGSFTRRFGSDTISTSRTSQTPHNGNQLVFARNSDANAVGVWTDARLAFYSIGESLDLALLDTRVSRLYEETQFAINTGVSGSGYDIDTLRYINAGYAAGGSLA
jgi:hypothetical protein